MQLYRRAFLYIFPTHSIANLAGEDSLGSFIEPLFAEIGVAVIAIEIGNREDNPIGVGRFICFAIDEKSAHDYNGHNRCQVCKYAKSEETQQPTETSMPRDETKLTDTQDADEESADTTSTTSGGISSCKSSVTATSLVLITVMTIVISISTKKKED